MLAVGKAPEEVRPGAAAPLIIREDLSQEELSGAYAKTLATASVEGRSNRTFAPLELPLIISGFSAGAFEKVRSFFAPPDFWPSGAGPHGHPGHPTSPRNRPSGKVTPWASSCSAAISTSPRSER